MQEFDILWNYSNPAETEQRFKGVMHEYSITENLSGHLQLLTQIARTYSLRRMFTEAHELLNEVETKLLAENDVAHIRYHLERGRTYNSAGNKDEANKHFTQARDIAQALGEDFYAIDALHMLAITATPEDAIKLNEQGVLQAEQSKQDRAKNWLGALYNNLGWAYFDKGAYEQALSIFLRALQWREGKQSAPEIFLAKWCVARTLRALGKLEEAIKIQLALLEEMIETSHPDGYVYEELGELHLLKGEEVHKMYFQFAYNELSKDTWLAANEPKRLLRIQQLAGAPLN